MVNNEISLISVFSHNIYIDRCSRPVIMYKSKCMPYCQQSPNTIKSLNEQQFHENIVSSSKVPCPLAEKYFTVMNIYWYREISVQ
jgi:hypothetical protein